MIRWYFLQILIALDQLTNTIFGGWADETLSARCYREKRWFQHVINLLFFWQTDDEGKTVISRLTILSP